MAAEPDRIGEWSATRVDGQGTADPRLQSVSSEPSPATKDSTASRRTAFGLGLLVGFIPLIAVGAGVIGYLLAGDDGDSGQVVDTDNAPAAAVDSTVASQDSTTTAAPTTLPPLEVVEPGAAIVGNNLRISGTVPSAAAEGYVEELTLLAIALGLLPLDETTVDDRAPAPTGVSVEFAEVVDFGQGGDVLLAEYLPVLDGIAAYLNAGTAEVTVVSVAGDGASEANSIYLAEHRAEHVFDHLVEQGVSPSRIVVDARGEIDPASGIDPTGNRVDVVFSIGL